MAIDLPINITFSKQNSSDDELAILKEKKLLSTVQSQQSMLICLLAVTIFTLIILSDLTNRFVSTNVVMAGYRQIYQREKMASSEPDEDIKAQNLTEKVRVLCWIMTSPKNLHTKAVHVRNTWARRCNIYLFMSSHTNKTFPTVGLNVPEGVQHLYAKTTKAFRYVYDHYFDEADWFMKADDDTYVIVENLRYFLSNKDTNSPIYFGHHFRAFIRQGFFSGGAGYVLSKEALRRFGSSGNDSKMCDQDGGSEDVRLGRCMANLGVKIGNTSDAFGRSRFHCFSIESHLHGVYPWWYYKWDTNGAKSGKAGISNYAISFHDVSPRKMYELEFFIYHLRPYGLQRERNNTRITNT